MAQIEEATKNKDNKVDINDNYAQAHFYTYLAGNIIDKSTNLAQAVISADSLQAVVI